MVYGELEDDEVIGLVHESSEDALDYLFEKYKYIINIVINKYIKSVRCYGYGYNDLYQEALVHFIKAIECYRNEKDMKLSSFITMCVERGISSWYRNITVASELPYYDAINLEKDNLNVPLIELISDKGKNDPSLKLEEDERLDKFFNGIEDILTEYEYMVYLVYIWGFRRSKVAEFFDKSTKQINSTIERIRKKLRKKWIL